MADLTPEGLVFRIQRRLAVSESPALAGLDFISVVRAASDRWHLLLHFVPPAAEAAGAPAVPPGITPAKVRLSVGDTVDREALVEAVEYPGEGGETLRLTVRLPAPPAAGHAAEDLPVYTLALVEVPGLDPLLSEAPFTFAPGSVGQVLAPPAPRLPAPPRATDLDYLAKDYASFRRLMLDRMALLVPHWTERNPADLGVAVVEALAYAADHLSYHQDAVATESYLGTARRRISVRRHARLLDYILDEGCNARAWVQVAVDRPLSLPPGIRLATRSPVLPQVHVSPSRELEEAVAQGARVFETMVRAELHPERNEMALYTWGAADVHLPEGATSAALEGRPPGLEVGQVLVIEQVKGEPRGRREDAEPQRAHAVRLTAVRPAVDPLTGQQITEVSWSEEDRLPFAAPVSMTAGSRTLRGLSVARGNVVLADHGRTVTEELPPVPANGRYAPLLGRVGLTHRVPFDDDGTDPGAAREALSQVTDDALPAITLYAYPAHSIIPPAERHPPRGERWFPQRDLLASGRFARDFVVETDGEGRARLRFGDGRHGSRPAPGTRFTAVYRVGNGTEGNLGPHAVRHLVVDVGSEGLAPEAREGKLALADAARAAVSAVTNHLPAEGGVEPEPMERARVHAPLAFRTQERCVTEADYVTAAERHPEVYRATCRLRWTGSWSTAFLYLQRPGGRPVHEAFRSRLEAFLAPSLIAGYQLELRAPHLVPLHIAMAVRLAPAYSRERVRWELLEALGSGMGESGERSLFHPDSFTFGQPVYLSEVVAAAAAVEGVEAVRPVVFHRWGEPERGELAAGRIAVGPLEIAQLANDPNAPQRGSLALEMEGGL